eukprot:m.25570 g.25570  ORF g.25570 m.25570 type:complete len:109 (+) comp11610_c0_seq8:60-386(+)
MVHGVKLFFELEDPTRALDGDAVSLDLVTTTLRHLTGKHATQEAFECLIESIPRSSVLSVRDKRAITEQVILAVREHGLNVPGAWVAVRTPRSGRLSDFWSCITLQDA